VRRRGTTPGVELTGAPSDPGGTLIMLNSRLTAARRIAYALVPSDADI
jgi:hypothetical protein